MTIDRQLCIKCSDNTQKFGTLNGTQRYQCVGCKTTFTDNTISRLNKRDEYHNKIKSMYLDGMSTTEIGKQLGVSSTVPQRILKKCGMTRGISDAKKDKLRGTTLPVDNIIERYKNGESANIIANDLGFAKSSVLKVLEDNEIPRDNEYMYEHPMDDEIKRLYIEGMSILNVSHQLGLPYTTVNARLHKFNLVRTEDKHGLGMDYNEYVKLLPAYKKYWNSVISITNKQPIDGLINSDKRGFTGVNGAYHLDHKFSIFEGFKQGVDPELIGNITNLEFIPWEENLSKGSNCSITLEELRVKTN